MSFTQIELERRCAEEEKRQDLSHLDLASSITEQLAASSSSELLDLSSIIEELSSPPFVSSRCPRCPKNSLFNNCSPLSHTFHVLSSAPSSPLREGTCSSPLPTSKQPSPHFSHFSSLPRHHRTRAFLEFQLAPSSFNASASIRPASKIRIVFK